MSATRTAGGAAEPRSKTIDINDAAMICAIEANYWAEVENEDLTQISLGAMGAASNICAALARNVSPDQYRREVESRPK